MGRIYTVNTVSRLPGKTKQNSNVEKKLKAKLHAKYVFTVLCCVSEFSKLFKLDIISFCIVCPFREAVILKGQFLTII